MLLDKLPLEVKTVLAGFSHLTLDETAQRADDILATVKTNLNPSTNPAASQHLFNQIIEQRINKLSDALETSLQVNKMENQPQQSSARSHNIVSSQQQTSFPRNQQYPQRPRENRPNRNFRSFDRESHCFYHSRFGAKAVKCQAPCAWRSGNRNFNNSRQSYLISYSCDFKRNLNVEHASLPIFRDPCTKVNFIIDTGAAVSLIPRSQFSKFKKYRGPQNLIAANQTPIHIFGTKKLNLDVGSRYTLPWFFKVANVDVPILGIDFLRYHGLMIDVVSNRLILPNDNFKPKENGTHSPLHERTMASSCAQDNNCFASTVSFTTAECKSNEVTHAITVSSDKPLVSYAHETNYYSSKNPFALQPNQPSAW